MSNEFILRVQCPDKYGIVAKISSSLNKANLFILDSAHYGDPENKVFFMRAKLLHSKKKLDIEEFSKYFEKHFSPRIATNKEQPMKSRVEIIFEIVVLSNKLLFCFGIGNMTDKNNVFPSTEQQ